VSQSTKETEVIAASESEFSVAFAFFLETATALPKQRLSKTFFPIYTLLSPQLRFDSFVLVTL
jgi:hypothetical protein